MIATASRQPRWRLLDVCVVAVLAFAMALALDALRSPASAPAGVSRVVDQRTAGERAVVTAQRQLAAAPEDPRALATLATAYLLRARETFDPTYYPKAEELLQRALAASSNDADVFLALGSLALSRH